MAQALAKGAVSAGFVQPQWLVFVEPNRDQQQTLERILPGCHLAESADELLERAQRVILAVKPPVLLDIAPTLAAKIRPGHLLVSIAAGISLKTLQDLLGTSRIARVMPNTPAQVGAGAAAIATPQDMSSADVAWVEQLMNSVGTAVRVNDQLMHAVTGVAGSSPAYIYLVIEALSDGGVALGLPRATATQLAAQAVLGAAKMVLDTGLHPGQLKDQVTSPGGTTIAALRELESAAVRSAFIEAVARCAERSSELAGE
jgi:pyrroline-5-carboxylate reductase